MKLFDNEAALAAYTGRNYPGVPQPVRDRAGRMICTLRAASEPRDITVTGTVMNAKDGRMGIVVIRKWVLSFEWEISTGVKEIRLERWKSTDGAGGGEAPKPR